MKTIGRKLNSEFTFGFEFEAISNSRSRNKTIAEKYFNGLLYSFGDDGSIDNYDGDNDFGFEFRSPVMTVTPKNISTTINFLKDMLDTCCYTNDTCGFHMHLGFPQTKNIAENNLWILLNLAFDDKMMDKVTGFKTYDFVNDRYASSNFLERIKNDLLINTHPDRQFDMYNVLRRYYTFEKYNILRIHPQGTLEWRGPRGFMNDGSDEVQEFFIKCFFPFVTWVSESLSKDTIKIRDYVLKKSSIIKELDRAKLLFEDRKTKVSTLLSREYTKNAITKFPSIKKYFKKSDNIGVIVGLLDGVETPILFNTHIRGEVIENCIIAGGTFTNCKLINCTFFSSKTNIMKISGLRKQDFFSIRQTTILNDCSISHCKSKFGDMLYINNGYIDQSELSNIRLDKVKVSYSLLESSISENCIFTDSKFNCINDTSSIFDRCRVAESNIREGGFVLRSDVENCFFDNSKLENTAIRQNNEGSSNFLIIKNCSGQIACNDSLIIDSNITVINQGRNNFDNKNTENSKIFDNIIKDGLDLFLKRIQNGYLYNFSSGEWTSNNGSSEPCSCGVDLNCSICLGTGIVSRNNWDSRRPRETPIIQGELRTIRDLYNPIHVPLQEFGDNAPEMIEVTSEDIREGMRAMNSQVDPQATIENQYIRNAMSAIDNFRMNFFRLVETL